MIRITLMLLLSLSLIGCGKRDIADASMWKICEDYEDICDETHSGALCTISRNDVIRTRAKQREDLTSINVYEALLALDVYKECLEDAYASSHVRSQKDKQSQMITINNIDVIQSNLVQRSNQLVRPEINLWRWLRTQNDDFIESMRNGAEIADEVHSDVYEALMMSTAARNMEEGLQYARKALKGAKIISEINPRVYEFYVGYYLDKKQVHKAAVWQGLYSARDEEKAKVNARYFRIYEQMSRQQIQKVQDEVEGLLFDAKWLNKKMSEFPKDLI